MEGFVQNDPVAVQNIEQYDSDSEENAKGQTSEDEERRDRFVMNKTPSQDMFYKNGRI